MLKLITHGMKDEIQATKFPDLLYSGIQFWGQFNSKERINYTQKDRRKLDRIDLEVKLNEEINGLRGADLSYIATKISMNFFSLRTDKFIH